MWHIELDKLFNINKIDAFLSNEEQERANRFIFKKHRLRFRAAHFALRDILSAYLNIPKEQIRFEVGEFGKPYLPGHPLHFNLSHSGTHALLGISMDGPIGVDIEAQSERDYMGIAKHSFSDREQHLLSEMSEERVPSGFFRIWTQKEAFIKLSGRGLSYPLNAFTVSPIPPDTLLHVKEEDSNQFTIDAFQVNEHLYGAVCLQGTAPIIEHYRFSYPLNRTI